MTSLDTPVPANADPDPSSKQPLGASVSEAETYFGFKNPPALQLRDIDERIHLYQLLDRARTKLDVQYRELIPKLSLEDKVEEAGFERYCAMVKSPGQDLATALTALRRQVSDESVVEKISQLVSDRTDLNERCQTYLDGIEWAASGLVVWDGKDQESTPGRLAHRLISRRLESGSDWPALLGERLAPDHFLFSLMDASFGDYHGVYVPALVKVFEHPFFVERFGQEGSKIRGAALWTGGSELSIPDAQHRKQVTDWLCTLLEHADGLPHFVKERLVGLAVCAKYDTGYKCAPLMVFSLAREHTGKEIAAIIRSEGADPLDQMGLEDTAQELLRRAAGPF